MINESKERCALGRPEVWKSYWIVLLRIEEASFSINSIHLEKYRDK